MMSVSVIVPNLHNPIIGRTIEGLLKQNYEGKYEIIVVGLDKYNLLEKFKKRKQVKIITTKKPEIASVNRNIGIKKATGDYLLFIDSDCIPEPNWIRWHMRNHANSNQIVIGSFLLEKSTNFWQFCDNISHFYAFSSKRKRGVADAFSAANSSLPKSLLKKVGIFNEHLAIGEDLEMSLRMQKAHLHLMFEPLAQVTHLPSRISFISILKHSYSWGQSSLKVRTKFLEVKKLPFFMKNKLTLILMTPIISLGVATNIFLSTPSLMQYFYILPIIICSKFAWCAGAISTWKKD